MNGNTQVVIFTAVITALTSSGFMSLIVYLIQRRDRKKEKEESKNTAQSRMLLGLGHDRIIYLTDQYVRRGGITLKEKRNLKYLFEPYADAGGNGDAEIGYKACGELSVISEEEAEALDAAMLRKELGIET